MDGVVSSAYQLMHLVGVGETTHTRHDAEHVVVGGIYIDVDGLRTGGLVVRANGSSGETDLKSGVVDTGHVTGARWLVLLGLESERVHVDAGRGHVGVVLVRLNEVEVTAFAFAETVVAIELELDGLEAVLTLVEQRKTAVPRVGGVCSVCSECICIGCVGVDARSRDLAAVGGTSRWTKEWKRCCVPHGSSVGTTHTPAKRIRRSASEVGLVYLVSEVEPLLTSNTRIAHTISQSVLMRLSDPHKFLARVVEVELDLVASRVDTFLSRELKLFNKVFVRHLSKPTTFIGVKVDVINVEGGGLEVETAADVLLVSSDSPVAVLGLVELEVDLDFVVLKGNEGKCKTWVAAEPELKRDEEGGRWNRGLGSVRAGVHLGKGRNVTNHVGVTCLKTWLLGKLVPNVKPLAVLLVHTLTTNLNLNVVDENVANPVQPAETSVLGDTEFRKSDLKVHAVHEVTITRDGAGHLLAEVRSAVEHLLNRLHGEVSMAPVDDLEKGDLRIASKVDILSPVGYNLHKTAAAHC